MKLRRKRKSITILIPSKVIVRLRDPPLRFSMKRASKSLKDTSYLLRNKGVLRPVRPNYMQHFIVVADLRARFSTIGSVIISVFVWYFQISMLFFISDISAKLIISGTRDRPLPRKSSIFEFIRGEKDLANILCIVPRIATLVSSSVVDILACSTVLQF